MPDRPDISSRPIPTRHPAATVIALALLCLPSTHAHAWTRMRPEPAVEWMVIDSDVIVRGVVTSARPISTLPQSNPFSRWERITVRVAETIKGPQVAAVTFTASDLRPLKWATGEHVFFLKLTARAAAQWAPSPEMGKIVAAGPLMMHGYSPISSTAMRPWPLYDGDLRPLDDPRQILDALRHEAQNPPPPIDRPIELMAAPTAPPMRVGGPGGLHFVLAVLDARATERARRWLTSANEYDRWNAAKILSHDRTPENVIALTRLLDDPFRADPPWPSQDADERLGRSNIRPRTLGPYPVRRLAYATLTNWKLAPSGVVLYEPKYPTVYPSPWLVAAAVLAFAALLGAVILSKWFGGRRRITGFSGASLLLLILTAALWARSLWRIDELAWHEPDGGRSAVTCANGSIRLMRPCTIDESEATPPAFTTAPRNPATELEWDAPPYPGCVVTRAGFLGFAIDRLDAAGFRFALTIPLWSVFTLFAILPATRAAIALRRHILRSQNRCPACGYDLRATPTRCPECGTIRSEEPRPPALQSVAHP